MSLTCRIGFSLLLLVSAATTVTAQVPVTLTLDDALARGLGEAPRVAEARAREAAAAASTRARVALFRPSVSLVSSYLRTNHVDEFGIPQASGGTRVIFPDIPDNYRTRTEIALPLFTSGRREGLVEAAEADARATTAERAGVEADLALEIATTYWSLVAAREGVAVRERALARADASLADVGARVDVGLLPPNDRLSARAQHARQRVALIEAEHQAALAEANLARLVGLPLDQPIVTATPVDEPMRGAATLRTESFETLTAEAVRTRPERAALVERRSSLRAAGDAAIAATRPQVSALAAVEPARPNPRFVPRTDRWDTAWDLAVSVSWSIWDGGRARAERAATVAQADAVDARLREFDSVVAVQIRERQLAIRAAEAALGAADEGVAAAREARRVVDERFDAGVASPTDVLDAEVAQLEAELERTRLVTALRVEEARLVRAVGRR